MPRERKGVAKPPVDARELRTSTTDALLEGAKAAVPILVAQLHLSETEPQLAQGAADKLLKYGIGTQRHVSVDLENVRERLSRTVSIIRRELPRDEAERVINALKPVWT